MSLHTRRQIHPGQPLDDLLAGEIPAIAVVECDDHERQAELRVREQPDSGPQARQSDFERNGDLLLALFGRAPRVKRDDGYLGVRDVRERLDGEIIEGKKTATDEQDDAGEDERRLAQRE